LAEADNPNRHYCVEQHMSFHECFLRPYEDGSYAFVCFKHCRRGDC
jgi:hypothetical protein